MDKETWEIFKPTFEKTTWFQELVTEHAQVVEKERSKAKDIETARIFKANNVPIDIILKGVPLTRQEVEAL